MLLIRNKEYEKQFTLKNKNKEYSNFKMFTVGNF